MLLLAHGASGSAASMRPWVAELEKHHVAGRALDLPKSNAARAVTVFREALEAAGVAVVGGHSYGGRVASMLAADGGARALVLLSYPLHRPGRPDDLHTAHWPSITCPVLLLSGERDPFAKIDLLRREVGLLEDARLITYRGLGHGLAPVLEDAVRHVARFMHGLA